MRSRLVSLLQHWYFGQLIVSIAAISCSAANPQTTPTQRQQVVFLPDPTPRPLDLHLKLQDNSQVGTATQDSVEHQKQRRHELIVWASTELVTLTERVRENISTSQNETAAANAEKVEELSKNLTVALRAR